MARGVRLPRTAGRPPRFLRTGHRRAISLNEAHLQAARRDARHTLEREAEGILQSLLFHRASRGLRAQRATFRVLAEGDPDIDAALASAVGCPPPPRSLTPPRPPLSDQRARAARRCGAAQIVRYRQRHAGGAAAALMLATSGFLASTGRAELLAARSRDANRKQSDTFGSANEVSALAAVHVAVLRRVSVGRRLGDLVADVRHRRRSRC